MRNKILLALWLAASGPMGCLAAPGTITIQVDRPTVSLPETLYGLFYEDINNAADGGLYAELVQNRSFEYHSLESKNIQLKLEGFVDFTPLSAWQKVEQEGGACNLSVESAQPLNDNNPHYALLRIVNAGKGVGLSNDGFGGISVEKGASYDFSLFAKRSASPDAPLRITLRNAAGEAIGTATVPGISTKWERHTAVLVPTETAEKATLEVVTTGAGEVCLDMVSLFPRDTFKGRNNGLRNDLAQAIAELNPKVFRFPGGCIVHGHGLENAYRWKETVGPVEARKPNWNLWGYHQTHGLGYFEYFQLCEDIGAEPLPILAVGVSCGFRKPNEFAPLDEVQPWIDDALDLVEFANGPADSRWGRVRAEMGHPAPFNLKYVGLGNEDHDTPGFRARFPIFVKALREQCPEIKIVGTSGLGPKVPLYDCMCEQRVDLSDEHYYQPPEWFIENQHRFDAWDRSQPPVFVGEYASRGNTMYNAVAEAIYLTGIERNADLVQMTAYAPLFARYGFTQWKAANLIWFDHKTVVRTPNYYVQQLFSLNKGDVYLENKADFGAATNLAVAASLDKATGDVVVKIANASGQAVETILHLAGVGATASEGTLTLLAGEKTAANTLEQPGRIQPVASRIKVGKHFAYTIPPMSVQFIRIPPGR